MKRVCLTILIAVLVACRPPRPGGHDMRVPAPPDASEVAGGARATTSAPAPVTFTDTPVPPAPRATPADDPGDISEVNEKLLDAYFDYDRSDLRPDAIAALQHHVSILLPVLARFSAPKLIVEGHCDERGSAEYNLALGDQRASRVRDFLSQLGLPPSRVQVISYGREKPQCTEPVESCWQLNRRAHLVIRE